MLQIIYSLVIYLVIASGYGSVLDKFLNSNRLLSFRLINGLLFIGLISLIIAMFVPLTVYYETFILLIGFVLFVKNACWKGFFVGDKSILFFALLTCFVASINAFLFDTFSYYLPTIKWLDGYGLVNGLANFDFNLGQTSLWHIIQATFNESFDWYYKINAFLIVIYLIYLSEIKQFNLLILLPLFYLFVASPSPDLPVIILSIILYLNWQNSKSNEAIKYGLIVGCFIVLIKPIAFVLPVFFFLLSLKNKSYFQSTYIGICGLVLLFLAKNIILTGNFLFPLSLGNLSFLKHAVPASIYDISAIEGRYMAVSRVNYISKEEIGAMSLFQYYRYLSNNLHLSLIIFGFIFLTQLFSAIYFYLKRERTLAILMALFLLKGLVFVAISPQYRFLLDGFLIVVVIILSKLNLNRILIYSVVSISAILFVFSKNITNSFSEIYFLKMVAKYQYKQLLVPKNYQLKTEKIQLFNFKANYVKRYPFSYNINQIAINPTLIDRYLMQKSHPELINNKDVKKGFYTKHNSFLDEEKLKKIYYSYISSLETK